ncbi:hypothetical protein KFL_002450110 [Klebsormidium nitens]|uniref:Uncharacterized protein n=1 Tax=Klebsormidium nitens TaxID=105231 RepID=A0A1Y1IC04_KLENI|nr:hypothetical protein KFL_002450110 [Klebsormidium nitens]|eukprot:GAQ85618.1 hypothetical protein KFL_002450110 [Klebsormidium nitens]
MATGNLISENRTWGVRLAVLCAGVTSAQCCCAAGKSWEVALERKTGGSGEVTWETLRPTLLGNHRLRLDVCRGGVVVAMARGSKKGLAKGGPVFCILNALATAPCLIKCVGGGKLAAGGPLSGWRGKRVSLQGGCPPGSVDWTHAPPAGSRRQWSLTISKVEGSVTARVAMHLQGVHGSALLREARLPRPAGRWAVYDICGVVRALMDDVMARCLTSAVCEEPVSAVGMWRGESRRRGGRGQ